MVPIDNSPVAHDAVLVASPLPRPAFCANWMTADGSYTAPAHKPTIAIVTSAAATQVRRR